MLNYIPSAYKLVQYVGNVSTTAKQCKMKLDQTATICSDNFMCKDDCTITCVLPAAQEIDVVAIFYV